MPKTASIKLAKDNKANEKTNLYSEESVRKHIPYGLQADILGLQRTMGNKAIHDILLTGGGKPLDPVTRLFMESRFNNDFSQVRIRTDAKADELTRIVNARAFTIGNKIVFRAGQFAPETQSGSKLLAHELAHVIQQRRGGSSPEVITSSKHERDASVAANIFSEGQSTVHVNGATGVGIARDESSPQSGEQTGSPQTPGPVLTEKEMLDFIVNQRGFTFNPSGAPLEDPAGVGRGIGPNVQTPQSGQAVFAMIQITDSRGSLVGTSWHAYLRSGDAHAEEGALRKLLHSASSNTRLNGGRITVVVDQEPCPKCARLLREFAENNGLHLRVAGPERPPATSRSSSTRRRQATRQSERQRRPVRPRTAAQGAQRTDFPAVKMRVFLEIAPSGRGGAVSGTTAPSRAISPQTTTPGSAQTGRQGQSAPSQEELQNRVQSPVGPQTRSDFKTQGKPFYPQRATTPQPTIRGTGGTRFRPIGEGLAQLLPEATSAWQDLTIRHGVATRMLDQWSQVENMRRDHPNDFIVCTVSLMEWERPDPAGQVARAINYVTFSHGTTVEAAKARVRSGLVSIPPKGWVEVGPFAGIIKPTDSLDKAKSHVESQQMCFIATACYGSPIMSEVCVLRELRDKFIRHNGIGRILIKIYYKLSPPCAEWLLKHDTLRRTIRLVFIAPIVKLAKLFLRSFQIKKYPKKSGTTGNSVTGYSATKIEKY